MTQVESDIAEINTSIALLASAQQHTAESMKEIKELIGKKPSFTAVSLDTQQAICEQVNRCEKRISASEKRTQIKMFSASALALAMAIIALLSRI